MGIMDEIVVSPFVPLIPQTPAAIRNALAPERRVEFEADYWDALAKDEEHPGAGAVQALIPRWWPEAVLDQQTGGRELLEQTERERQAGTLETIECDPEADLNEALAELTPAERERLDPETKKLLRAQGRT